MRLVYLLAGIVSLNVPNALAGPVSKEEYRRQIREWVMSHAATFQPTIAPEANDQAENLVDQVATRNLADMETKGLLRAELAEAPWSDTYWPIYAGEIANRYADPNYSASLLWKSNRDYLTRKLGKGPVDQLSPAEKYDLLVGDSSFTMTKTMIQTGAPYADNEGKVEAWMGICHGWAPASFMLPRPKKAVRVKAADGRDLTFYPSDIKALATLLWANGAGETRFVGGRCNSKTPGRDDDGRENEKDCFDTNPATWHLSVVNQLGVNKRSFVMDASAGFEVWNQPVMAYNYGYINPVTHQSGTKLADAKVLLKDLPNDPFKAHRSPDAVAIAEVVMSVTYVSETSPTAAESDGPENDAHLVVNYHYDLELDAADNIVGGEWRGSMHPDFLWVPVKESVARSRGDLWLDQQNDQSKWDGRGPLPALWKKAAKAASALEEPLARIVNGLLERAND